MRPLHRPVLSAWLVLSLTSTQLYAQPAPPAQPAEAPPAADAPVDEAAEEAGDEVLAAPGDAPANETPPAAPGNAAEGEGDMGEADMGEESPSRPPSKGKGVVWGVITDTKRSEPLIEATVTVVQTGQQLLTDVDGRYRFEGKPGTYTLRVDYEMHKPERIEQVSVALGKVNQLDVSLVPEELVEDVVEVETKADTSTIEGQMIKRQKAVAVGDGIGRAEISKNPDSNAAEAAQRVVGANIVGGRFVYVRGLGERYSNALLNGLPLPSPVPDRAAVPLDLFPALMLDSLTINKTFTPDVPGDFAGGSVRIETRDVPEEFLFSMSGSLGYAHGTTFQDRLDHRGGSTDWLGYDSGLRDFPATLPQDHSASSGTNKPGADPLNPTPEQRVSGTEVTQWGRELNSYMSATESGTPENHGLAAVVGNGWKLSGEQKLGAIVALNYGRSYAIRNETLREFQAAQDSPTGLVAWNDLKVERGAEAVKWGGLGTVVYDYNKHHQLHLVGLRSQLSDKKTSLFDGFSKNVDGRFHNTRLEFVSQSLGYLQLGGDHEMDKSKVAWNASVARATREQPDTRDTVFNFTSNSDGKRWSYLSSPESGRHFYSDQSEITRSAALDFTQELRGGDLETSVKVGGMMSLRDREFGARRLAFAGKTVAGKPYSCPGAELRQTCLDDLFTAENIGADKQGLLELGESTQKQDAYDAVLDVYAGYVMADIKLIKPLRVTAGERIEFTRQVIEPFDQLMSRARVEGARLVSQDLLPAVSATYDTSAKTKLRASLARTLARPQLRELAPFAFSDFFGGALTTGEPTLELTHIVNYDLRFEYFPTLAEVIALSGFAKQFSKPIERVQEPAGSSNNITFVNSDSATLLGVELEARKTLEFLDPGLESFTVIGNLTLTQSSVRVPQTGNSFITNTKRSLTNQSPYIINLALDYTGADSGLGARVLYNVNGPSIVEVGLQGLQDAYEQPRHIVDVSLSQELGKQFKIKGVVENLFDAPFLVTQGKEKRSYNVSNRYQEGVEVTLTASYTH